jgi:hypothetical protein
VFVQRHEPLLDPFLITLHLTNVVCSLVDAATPPVL